jgi:hypothetical protein
MEIFEKRGRWRVRGKQGGLRKFKTEQEALEFAGIEPVVEEDLVVEEEIEIEEEDDELD